MSILQNKIDFVAIVEAHNIEQNANPLNTNLPLTTHNGFEKISDGCIKRKIRNRLIDMGENIFLQGEDKTNDGFKSLKTRVETNKDFTTELKKGKKADSNVLAKTACKQWMDVRSFGQIFAFKKINISISIRGPVSIYPEFIIEPTNVTSIKSTKSVNVETNNDSNACDIIGTKHRVDFGIYILKGSINVELAEVTEFTEEDAEKIKNAIRTLFVNDYSSTRPDRSMKIVKLYWWKHNCKTGQYASKTVHDSIKIIKKDDIKNPKSINDYKIIYLPLDDIQIEEYEGI